MYPAGKTSYSLEKSGKFTIHDYNSAKLFSSFFPGVAGKEGIPMWLFYVNRGQCVCSMGIHDKDNPIMEFLPANRAYQLVSSQGFRTFIKLPGNDTVDLYEPFQNHQRGTKIAGTQRMIIDSSSLTLEEVNHTLGLRFTVDYFNIPQEKYAGLVRILRIKNLKDEILDLEGLDGLPLIIPYGIDNSGLKFIRRLIEAFVEVSNYENGVPFFRGKVKPADRPDVVRIEKGNFYVGFESGSQGTTLIKPLVDPVKIFGSQSDFSYPEEFLRHSPEEMFRGQILENRLPCCMGIFKTSIAPGDCYTYISIIGHASSTTELNSLIPIITAEDYIEEKAQINKELIESLTQNNFICSQLTVLDRYTRQNFLDNTLRGGFPYTFSGNDAKFTLHLYSRKHGDLERDYNDYKLTPTWYSQGNGNFRDVNQNRRNDLLFNPDVKESNLLQFYNLIQLDGYNPLVIKETRLKVIDQERLSEILEELPDAEEVKKIKSYLRNSFTPGQLTEFLLENEISLEDPDSFIGSLSTICERIHDTDYGEGFWTDHWTYNLDLLENYLAVYPENLYCILFQKKEFSFYDNPNRVQSRDEKYVIWERKYMQLGSVVFDEEKDNLISCRTEHQNKVHTDLGKGEVYYTTLINNLICLIVNKMASLDPEGVGVEMEADKPNWYDALNGLPGLLGSSISETLEIKRHIQFLLRSFHDLGLGEEKWFVYAELKDYMDEIHSLLRKQFSSFEFWDRAASAKESYREQTRLGIDGSEKQIISSELTDFFRVCLKKLDEGIKKARSYNNEVIPTYFINEVIDHKEIVLSADNIEKRKCNPKGLSCFRAVKFQQQALPLFLEGPVHYLRTGISRREALELVKNIRDSGLFDDKLKMYKVNESLQDQPMEIGRARTFSPGWFENESIWLHMEYKFMLELLRNGLFTEFYTNFKHVFVPFFKPEIYGRSILENSSFIVSSANPDPSIHGNGFVARLSGATAEFIHILLYMIQGPEPFSINENGELRIQFKPVLPGWLFTTGINKRRLYLAGKWQKVVIQAHTFSFMFLGSILISYHNPGMKDTFGPDKVSPAAWTVYGHSGNSKQFQSGFLEGEIAEKIRNREISRIEIELN